MTLVAAVQSTYLFCAYHTLSVHTLPKTSVLLLTHWALYSALRQMSFSAVSTRWRPVLIISLECFDVTGHSRSLFSCALLIYLWGEYLKALAAVLFHSVVQRYCLPTTLAGKILQLVVSSCLSVSTLSFKPTHLWLWLLRGYGSWP